MNNVNTWNRHDWAELERAEVGRFKSVPHYDADTDSLTLFIKPDESYRERVDPILTVYRSIKTNDVVGCHVKGVQTRKLVRTGAVKAQL